MDEIKSWTFSICSASIFGAIMNIILPEGSTQKIFKSVFCVFFLCCLISPLLNMNLFNEKNILNSFDYEYREKDDTENRLYESAARTIEDEIRSKTEEILRQENIEYSNISVRVNILEGGGIEIIEFRITAYSDISESLKEKIGNETGLIPDVEILGESF